MYLAPSLRDASPAPDARLGRLRRWNGAMAALHLGQAVVILLVASPFSLPVTSAFLRMSEETQRLVAVPGEIGRLRIGPLVAAFFLLSAASHAAVASPWLRRWYERNLTRGINPARWVEYALSSSVMIVVIAMLVGIYDVASLVLIFALNATMILFGWLQERMNPPGRSKTTMMPFWFGTLAGMAPWAAIWVNVIGAAKVPGFVYGIVISLFLFFNVFAIVQWLQYKQIGRFADYLAGERFYIVLSFVAKSALAWQIFGGVLGSSAAG